MTFYVVLWVIVMICGIQYYFSRQLPSKKYFVLLIFVLSCIVGARDEFVGADTSNYVEFYDTGVAPDKLSGTYEPLFMLVRYICYHLGFNHFVFFFLLAFLSMYLLYLVAERLKIRNYYLAFFIYFSIVFLSYQFNTIRNGVMASLIWLAFVNKIEGKEKITWVLMLAAAGFHLAAIAFIPLLFFIRREISPRFVLITLAASLVCVFFRLGERLIDMFPILNEIDRVAGYVNVDEDSSYGISIGTIFNIALFLFMFFYYHDSYRESVECRVIVNAMLMAIMVVCVFNPFHAIVSRIGQVLNLSLMFVWPLFIRRINKGIIKFLVLVVLCAYLWLYFSKGLQATSSTTFRLVYIPYVWDFHGLFR